MKKELSLASRYRIPVIALRIEDVEPSDAFAYELSTRQWIDAFFDGRGEKAIDDRSWTALADLPVREQPLIASAPRHRYVASATSAP